MKVRMSKPKKYRCNDSDCEKCFYFLVCHPEHIEDYQESKEIIYEGDY